MDRRGFTLIELVVTVAILAILAAIAIPAYIGQQKRAARTEAWANLQNLRLLEEQYFAENGEYAPGNKTANGTMNYVEIVASLPNFKPGAEANLEFTYTIDYMVSGNSTTAFTAHARGKTDTRVVGDDFTIDQNNTKNF